MSPATAWKLLGIARSTDTGAVRRAYAALLKAFDPDSDPDAFARLREARDAALANARALAAKAVPVEDLPEPEEDEDEWDDHDYFDEQDGSDEQSAPLTERPEPWTYSAAGLDAVPRAEGSVVIPLPDSNAPMPVLNPGFGAGSAKDGAPLAADPWAVPALSPAQAEYSEHLVLKRTPADQRLWGLLYANGDDDTAPFNAAELKGAKHAQNDVLADASAGNLAMHGVIENWLANALAGAWPRSAPLLEAASGYFGWEREAGKLSERASIAFLNARLKGMRFEAKVLDPKHRLHKAWVELQREGSGNALSRMRASKHDVRTLLEGVRKNFPELEEHLDAQRVAAWEKSGGMPGPSRNGGPSWRWWAIGAFVLIRLLMAIGDTSPSKPVNPLDAPEDLPVIQQAVIAAFGSGTIDTVQQSNAELAQLIKSNVSMDRTENVPADHIAAHVANLIRERALEAARSGSLADLESAMRVRLGLLRAAKAKDAAACTRFLRLAKLDDDVAVPKAVIAADQKFSSAMLLSGKLGLPPRREGASAMVPGVIMGQIIRSSGVPEARVRQAMGGKGSDADSCLVRIALLQATLAWKGKDRWAILKTL